MAGRPHRTPPRRRRGARFWLQVALANALVFGVLFVVGELAVRIWREHGIGGGLASLFESQPTPRNLGTGDWLVPDPARGYVLRPGRSGVNSLGVRHAELAVVKPDDERRLLLIGDSVTWPDDGYAALLQQAFAATTKPHIDVVNAAVPGYTTHQERCHLECLCEPVAPDLVVLQFCLNDNHRFLHQLAGDGHWLITAEARRALLPEGDDPWTRWCRWSYLALEVRQRLFALEHGHGGPFPWQHDPAFAAAWRDDSWALVDSEIGAMHQLLQSRSVPLLVLAVPFEPQLRDESRLRDRAYTEKPQARLAALCAARGLPLLDLLPVFLAHRDEALFVDAIHLTPRGHQLVAERLLARLHAEHLLPPR